MNRLDIETKVLDHLFVLYLEHGGTPLFSVGEIISSCREDPTEVLSTLNTKGFLHEIGVYGKDFKAKINMVGISRIRPDWVNAHINKAISTLGIIGGGRQDLMEILDLAPKDYQIGRDLARWLENMDLITTIHTHNQIMFKEM